MRWPAQQPFEACQGSDNRTIVRLVKSTRGLALDPNTGCCVVGHTCILYEGQRSRAYFVMRFVDLFAGLGGFHQALANSGHQCVLAAELDEELIDLYQLNHGIRPHSDVTKLQLDDVPEHDILCAGFPCQPFSKAGAQLGRNYPGSGTLFDHVLRILRKRRPEHIIFENVPNLLRHDDGLSVVR